MTATPTPESLRPLPDRGAALLVVGGSRAERAQRLDELALGLAQVAEPPLVVRVGPGSPGSQDAVARIHDAVEAALTQVRAPGGLYDDRGGGLLRHLGGWIFRARTVRRAGLVLVVDELHRLVDRRGRGGADEVTPEIASLLASCGSRAVTVVASTAGASASGTAALPAELLAGFTDRVALGAPPTVTRDPATVLTALGGRSFSPDGLVRAIFGWLDLPHPSDDRVDDDTVVVFSSPLTPPIVPDPAPLEWPAAVAPSTHAPSIPPSAAPVDADEIARWRAVLAGSVRMTALLPEARSLRTHPANDRDAFVARLLAGPVQIPLLRDALARGSSLGEPSARMQQAARAALADLRAGWSSARDAASEPSRWFERLRRVAEAEGARASAWWLLPGLRVDLVARLEAKVLAPLGFQRIDGGVTRSLAGASTSAASTARVSVGGSEATRLHAYAAALAEGGPLDEAASRAEHDALVAMRSLAGGFTGRTAVLLMADVGAAEPDGPRDRRPLGGACPFAELVPWGLYTFGGNEP